MKKKHKKKIAALSKMASSPSLVSRPSLPIMRIWAPGGQQGRGLGGRASGGISSKMGMWFFLGLTVGPVMSLLSSVSWPHSLPRTSLSKPSRRNLGPEPDSLPGAAETDSGGTLGPLLVC